MSNKFDDTIDILCVSIGAIVLFYVIVKLLITR